MKAVRLTRANGLNELIRGDANELRFLPDDMADHAVNELRVAVYAPEHDPQLPPVTFVGPEAAAQRLTELTEKLGLYGEPPAPPEYDPVQVIEDDLADMAFPGPEMTPPSPADSKARWIRWAMFSDGAVTAQKAAAMTKGQLMSRYGQGL